PRPGAFAADAGKGAEVTHRIGPAAAVWLGDVHAEDVVLLRQRQELVVEPVLGVRQLLDRPQFLAERLHVGGQLLRVERHGESFRRVPGIVGFCILNPMTLDLNADLGEGVGTDAELLALVTSANVSCGAHAGDPAGIYTTLELAAEREVVVGAHPGYPDRANFGRVPMAWTEKEVWANVMTQAGGLIALAEAADGEVSFLKPPRGPYPQAWGDPVPAPAAAGAAVG